MHSKNGHAGRDYRVPDSTISFWATGVYEIEPNATAAIGAMIAPIQSFCNPVFAKNPAHITCRYLGYCDEESYDCVKEIIPKLKAIYQAYLPLSCTIGKLFGSWEENPHWPRKLIMAKVDAPALFEIHNKILDVTKNFLLFTAVEGEKFNPHVSLAYVKDEYVERTPPAVLDFIATVPIAPIRFSVRAAYVRSNDGKGFDRIVGSKVF